MAHAARRGPAPPSGQHRYVFLLYQQPGTMQVGASNSLAGCCRCTWRCSNTRLSGRFGVVWRLCRCTRVLVEAIGAVRARAEVVNNRALRHCRPTSQIQDPSQGNTTGRAGFQVRDFAKQYGLGNPVAALYYLSQR